MAGPRNIQRTPFGLLQALNMVGSGENPKDLAPDLNPTIRAEGFYGLPTIGVTGNVTAFAGNGNTLLTVPQNEIWRVHFIGGIITRDVADIALTPRAVWTWFDSPGATSICIASEELPAIAAGNILLQQVGIRLAEPMWMRPRQQLGFGHETSTSANNWSVAIRACREAYAA